MKKITLHYQFEEGPYDFEIYVTAMDLALFFCEKYHLYQECEEDRDENLIDSAIESLILCEGTMLDRYMHDEEFMRYVKERHARLAWDVFVVAKNLDETKVRFGKWS